MLHQSNDTREPGRVYTVIAYSKAEGAAFTQTVRATDAKSAVLAAYARHFSLDGEEALLLGESEELSPSLAEMTPYFRASDCELIAVMGGEPSWCELLADKEIKLFPAC